MNPKHFKKLGGIKIKCKRKWCEAIRLEFNKMIKLGVWREVDREKRNAYKQLVGSKWVFKIKRNGVYRARLVAKGLSQIPGEDFTEHFSPVINDVTFSIVLTRMIIDNPFLNRDLDHEIFMKMPEGYKE